MNSEKILKKINRGSVTTLIFGIVLALIGAFLTFSFFLAEGGGIIVITAILIVAGVALAIFGGSQIGHPERSNILKANPNLLKQADELGANIKHEDDLIIFSDRIVASKQDLTQIAYFDDVLLIYEYKHTVNFVTAEHTIKLATADYTAAINVYGYKKDIVNALVGMLYRMCPNAVPAQSQQDLNLRIAQISKQQRERKKQRKSMN